MLIFVFHSAHLSFLTSCSSSINSFVDNPGIHTRPGDRRLGRASGWSCTVWVFSGCCEPNSTEHPWREASTWQHRWCDSTQTFSRKSFRLGGWWAVLLVWWVPRIYGTWCPALQPSERSKPQKGTQKQGTEAGRQATEQTKKKKASFFFVST